MAAKKKSSGKKYSSGAGKKVEKVMREKKRGTLKSGSSGKKVTSRKQAIAIGLSEARKAGAIVCISSIMGIAYGWDEHVHYSSAKSGVVGLIQGLKPQHPLSVDVSCGRLLAAGGGRGRGRPSRSRTG